MPQLQLEELKAGIEEAHKVSLRTAAHSQGPEGSKNAVLAGIDFIEHGVALSEETIEEMVKRNVFLVPTLRQRNPSGTLQGCDGDDAG